MGQLIAMVSVLVADYDEAIAYYTRALRFTVVEDKPQGPSCSVPWAHTESHQ